MLSKYMTPKHIWTLIFTKEQDSYEFPEPQTKDFYAQPGVLCSKHWYFGLGHSVTYYMVCAFCVTLLSNYMKWITQKYKYSWQY